MVTYRPIDQFPGYRVGDDGSVWSCRTPYGRSPDWHRLNPQPRRGYLRVGLRREAKLHWRCVHLLVLESFVGARPTGHEGCHRDNDRRNNSLDNLRWDTPAGNRADSEHKRRRGSHHRDAKLSERDIPQIRTRVARGESRRSVARSFGVSHSQFNSIVNGNAWRHVSMATRGQPTQGSPFDLTTTRAPQPEKADLHDL